MQRIVLIVDDSESIREVISAGLETEGFNVIKGIHGADALEKLKANNKVSLIITDLNMPVMDGITFLKEVRKAEEFKFVPVVILTTESQESKKQEARNAGATAWIVKPFTKEKLLTVIKKVIR